MPKARVMKTPFSIGAYEAKMTPPPKGQQGRLKGAQIVEAVPGARLGRESGTSRSHAALQSRQQLGRADGPQVPSVPLEDTRLLGALGREVGDGASHHVRRILVLHSLMRCLRACERERYIEKEKVRK